MVELNTIVVLEVQPISAAFPALLLQEFAFPTIEQWMPAQTFTSRRAVAVIGLAVPSSLVWYRIWVPSCGHNPTTGCDARENRPE